MRVLFDTNILARAVQNSHPRQEAAIAAVAAIVNREDVPCLLPQNLYEFWVVCTPPADENGLGIAVETAGQRLEELKDIFEILDETPAFLPAWKALVVHHEARGKAAHDARLVAGMQVHGITRLVTFNKQQFIRYPGGTVTTPEESIESPGS